jgi:hypothetical protein
MMNQPSLPTHPLHGIPPAHGPGFALFRYETRHL